MVGFFDKGTRAVLVIGVVSLVAALVCFGLLESTGALSNDAWSLGGAIAGFLAAVYALDRVYMRAEGSLIPVSERKKSTYVFEEVVKVLDLRTEVFEGDKSASVITDYYQLIKGNKEKPELVSHYATMGERIEGVSLSHPHDFEWEEKTHSGHELGQDHHLRKEYELKIDLSHLAPGQSEQVINRLTYVKAFEGEHKEWLHTHMDHPTARLAMIILFPHDRPCKSIKGFTKSGREPLLEYRHPRPVRLENGSIAYWRVEGPEQGAQYQLEWEWLPRTSPATTVTNVRNP
jgi:hypothetical protein